MFDRCEFNNKKLHRLTFTFYEGNVFVKFVLNLSFENVIVYLNNFNLTSNNFEILA